MQKFQCRGKQVDNGEWVYGYYWQNEGNHYIRSIESKLTEPEVNYWENVEVDYEVYPATVGKYNEHIKAYEGDIIEWIMYESKDFLGDVWHKPTETPDKYSEGFGEYLIRDVVDFSKPRSLTRADYIGNDGICFFEPYYNYKIIGNETDNPELMKGSD